jgi:hypothetical protein
LPSAKTYFLPLSEADSIPSILRKNKGQNAHFSVATRTRGNGSKHGIVEIPALWVDIDFKGRSLKAVLRKLKAFSPKPSAVLETGGGFHAYWFLRRPAPKRQIPEIESLQKRLVSEAGADPQATDASHSLRIPGSLNLKRDRFRTHLIRFKARLRYRLSDFDSLASLRRTEPSQQAIEVTSKPRNWAEKILLEGVSEGERNDTITRLAGRYVRMGLSERETLPILLRANRRFTPPLEKQEVIKALKSIIRTHLRNRKNEEEDDLRLTTLTDVFAYPEVTYLIDRILPEGMLLILGARQGVGKSLLALSIIKSVLTGNPLWGEFEVRKAWPVLLVDEETPKPILKDRCMKMGFHKKLPLHFLHFQGARLDKVPTFGELMARIEETDPVLVVFDSFVRVHHAKENDAQSIAGVMNNLRKITNRGITGVPPKIHASNRMS